MKEETPPPSTAGLRACGVLLTVIGIALICLVVAL